MFPICCEKVKDKSVTVYLLLVVKWCKQAFCNSCLDEALKQKPCCPTFTVSLRKVTGNQPFGGTMAFHTYPKQKLTGYKQYGSYHSN